MAIYLAAQTIKVGRARGHEVEPFWGITAQRFVDASDARGMADVERYVCEQGRQVGIQTPFNDTVVELITGVPPGTLKPAPKSLDPLVAMLPK